jgi:hypothetical protein
MDATTKVPLALPPAVAEARERHLEMYFALRDEINEVRRRAPVKALRLPEGLLLRRGGLFSLYGRYPYR